ncbi:MAG: acyl-CoA dehydrogenase family protein [Desulfobacterales bacterium]|nr:acyl-CoA dehydrogenase family protein [Desulfobacterales bacterium]
MAEKFISDRNLKFLLYEMLDVEQLTKYPEFADHSRETFDMVMETAMKMGKDLFKPLLTEMDRNQPEYVGGEVKVHPQVRTILKECGEGGWIGSSFPAEWGGQQLPMIIGMLVPTAIWGAANYSGSVYSGLTTGAAALIASFCDEKTRDMYLPRMMSGEWQGTMALTEPQAGSSLTDVTLTGTPTDQGYYQIKGQKIFISAGDHNGVDNAIHLVLGRVKDVPSRGSKAFPCSSFPRKESTPAAT